MHSRRFRHLLLLAHVWACLPFLLIWLLAPGRVRVANPHVHATVSLYLGVIAVYLAARTVLAWRDPSWLAWEYIFPVGDVLLISLGLYLRQDPDSVLTLAYFFAIAEAAGTLNIRWACLIGVLCVVGATAATWGVAPTGAVGAVFRLFFLVIMASLLTWMARLTSELRARLTVAAERNRLALEMHDGVQGQLVAIAAQMELLQRIAPQDGTRAAQIAVDSRDLARQAAEELRYMARRLRSPRPMQELLPALQHYLQQMGARSGLEVSFQVTGPEAAFCPEQEHALFRIAQESMTNVIKHAKATRLKVEFEFGPQEARFTLKDNGIGFDVANLPKDGAQSGLENMERRAQDVGGVLYIESQVGTGTILGIVLPYSPCREQIEDAGENTYSIGGR